MSYHSDDWETVPDPLRPGHSTTRRVGSGPNEGSYRNEPDPMMRGHTRHVYVPGGPAILPRTPDEKPMAPALKWALRLLVVVVAAIISYFATIHGQPEAASPCQEALAPGTVLTNVGPNGLVYLPGGGTLSCEYEGREIANPVTVFACSGAATHARDGVAEPMWVSPYAGTAGIVNTEPARPLSKQIDPKVAGRTINSLVEALKRDPVALELMGSCRPT